jgi:hypothetical protein
MEYVSNRSDDMSTARIVAALSALALIMACNPEDPTSVPTSVAPKAGEGANQTWVITTYYWQNDGWVEHASWNDWLLGPDLRIEFNAHNWQDQYPAFWASFDNVYAIGDTDWPEALVDDFDDGVISTIWDGGGEDCVVGQGAEACEADGVLTADVFEGSDNGQNHFVGLSTTEHSVHGEFDVRIEFALDPEFHSAPRGQTNVMLCMRDESGYATCNEIDSGYYVSGVSGPDYWRTMRITDTGHLAGKLRITRTSAKDREVVRRPYHWSVHDLQWPGGLGDHQLQSVYPLDATGDLVLVGGQGFENDYVVFDLSSGSPVVVAGSGNLLGYKTAAFSLKNSSVGFGGGDVLVKYDGAFELIPMPCGEDEYCRITGIWASSPTDVWTTRFRRVPTGPTESVYFSEIWYWNGDSFALEYQVEAGFSAYIHLWDIWGHASEPMFAVGERLLQRNADGAWQEMLGPEELPATCDYLFKVRGRNPADVWASGFFGECLLHYDGKRWSVMPRHEASPNSIWPLDAKQILWAGQGYTAVELGRISIWGSVDGGESWTQLQDPVFSQLPAGGAYAAFFDIAGTVGGTRVFAPTITGGRLVIGSLIPFESHVTAFAASAIAKSVDSEELVLPEPEK